MMLVLRGMHRVDVRVKDERQIWIFTSSLADKCALMRWEKRKRHIMFKLILNLSTKWTEGLVCFCISAFAGKKTNNAPLFKYSWVLFCLAWVNQALICRSFHRPVQWDPLAPHSTPQSSITTARINTLLIKECTVKLLYLSLFFAFFISIFWGSRFPKYWEEVYLVWADVVTHLSSWKQKQHFEVFRFSLAVLFKSLILQWSFWSVHQDQRTTKKIPRCPC